MSRWFLESYQLHKMGQDNNGFSGIAAKSAVPREARCYCTKLHPLIDDVAKAVLTCDSRREGKRSNIGKT